MEPQYPNLEQVEYIAKEFPGGGLRFVVIGGPEEGPDVIPCPTLVDQENPEGPLFHVALKLTENELKGLVGGGTLWLTTWGGLPVHLLHVQETSQPKGDIGELADAIRLSWDANTASGSEWDAARPSTGQCAVSALIVQDEFGGDLLRAVVQGVSHYWNRLPDGTEVDLTRDQFDVWCPTESSVRDRSYVLSFPETALRYELLRDRVQGRLGGAQ